MFVQLACPLQHFLFFGLLAHQRLQHLDFDEVTGATSDSVSVAIRRRHRGLKDFKSGDLRSSDLRYSLSPPGDVTDRVKSTPGALLEELSLSFRTKVTLETYS